MIRGQAVLALIPARGGSKGLPDKNVRPIGGKPLIAWSIEQAKQASCIAEVLVTTDSEAIAEVARRCGASVPFLRPAHLATDDAPTFGAVQHALDYLRAEEAREFGYVVLLEPTSPLRAREDIDRMLARLDDRADDYDAIVSVGVVNEHPSILKRLTGDELEPYCPDLPMPARRQDVAPAYFPYGVAYIVKTRTLLAERTFYPKRCMAFPIQRYQCYEIDDLYDFLCVEAIMRHEWGA
jgi:CMP-N,N'-diacetyllegionaminic acid synthase